MKPLLFALFGAIAFAQSQPGDIVACNLSIEGSATMKQLYGKKVPLYTGSVVGKNYSASMISISSVDIYLALETVNRLPNSDASAILTKAFNGQPIQEISSGIGLAAAGVGIATAVGSPITIGARALAYILFGITFGQNALVPFLQAGQPSLSSLLANQCESMGSGGTLILQPGGTFGCNMFIQKATGVSLLPTNIPFDLFIDAPPAPSPLPAPTPLLRTVRPMRAVPGNDPYRNSNPPQPPLRGTPGASLHINPDAVAAQLSHVDMARKLYWEHDYDGADYEYNMAIKENPADAPALWREASAAIAQINPGGKELAARLLEKYK